MIALPDGRGASLITESVGTQPATLTAIDDQTRANDAVRMLRAGQSLLWTGDYVNGRHLIRAVRSRIERRRNPVKANDALARWRNQRASTRARAELLGAIFVLVETDGSVALRRAPDTRTAVELAWGLRPELRIVALNTLIGALSAAEWTRKGLEVPGLDGLLTPRFGVFSPTRSVYIELLQHLDVEDKSVIDVGCGTGVLAFVLLQRGARSAIGTDIDPRAVICATNNAVGLGLDGRFHAVQADLFPPDQSRADCIVFNAPWIPEAPRTRLDRAVFDEGGLLLRRFLAGLDDCLMPGGSAALLISDLPERLGLRKKGDIEQLVHDAGLRVVLHADAAATHRRTRDSSDPLHNIRAKERVGIWVLSRASDDR